MTIALSLKERLKNYIDSLGGIDTIAAMPDKTKLFILFIEQGKQAGDNYQALLGCTLQNVVDNADAQFAGGVKKALESVLSDDKANLLDAHSYQYLFQALLNPAHDASVTCSAEDGKWLARVLGRFIDNWRRTEQRTSQKAAGTHLKIAKEWHELIERYDASPFKEKSVAIVGNTFSIDGCYEEAVSGPRTLPTEEEMRLGGREPHSPASILFKEVVEFNRAGAFLDESNAARHAGRFDVALDCNAATSSHSTDKTIPFCMARLLKTGGIAVYDLEYDSRHVLPKDKWGLCNPVFHELLNACVLEDNKCKFIILRQEKPAPETLPPLLSVRSRFH